MYVKKEELLSMLEDRKSAVNKALEESVNYEVCRSLVEEENIIDSIIEDINDLNVYDEQEEQFVKYGEWIPADDISPDYWRCCSNCYHLEKRDYKRFKFCPNCGADMRGNKSDR